VLLLLGSLLWNQSLVGQELVQAPNDFAFYKLSKLRVEKDVLGDVIVFDYQRTREGKGEVRLAARTDQGALRITGLFRIEQSGTIRLQDQFANVRSILNRDGGATGMEFYFVAGGSIGWMGGKRYLVSNAIRHGSMNTRISARPLTKAELEQAEQERIARLPPATVPAGYTRGTANTALVPGAPIMLGLGGKWHAGTVVSLPSSTTVKAMREGSPLLSVLQRDQWIAISDQTVANIRDNPGQFSISVRTLPKGNLILDDDVEPLTDAMSLPKGTPLLMEQYSRWADIYFLSSDNVSVRALSKRSGRSKLEIVPLDKIAIRKQTKLDLQKEDAKKSFAANVADFETNGAGFPQGGGSMATSGFDRGPEQTADKGDLATPPTSQPITKSPVRTWSDASGKFTIEARLARQNSGNAFLERTDGKVVQVPIDRLSAADQTYLQEQAGSGGNPFANVVESDSPGSMSAGGGSSNANVDYRSPLQVITKVGDLRHGAKSVAISPDNQFLLIGRKAASASLCDLKTGRILIDSGRMDHIGDVSVCGFTPDGTHVVIAGYKGVAEIYEFSSKGQMKLKKQFAVHTREVTSLAFSADSKFALTGGSDKEAHYWEIETGRKIATLSGFKGKVKATCIKPAGNQLLATDGAKLIVFDVSQNKTVREVEVGKSWASGHAAAFSANGLLLAAGDSYDFRLWNLESFSEMPAIKGESIAWSMVFAPDNQHFFTGHNGVINIWDAKTQSRVLSQPIGKNFYVQAIATNSKGTLITSPSDHNSVVVLQAAGSGSDE
jgi:hypothetical protein